MRVDQYGNGVASAPGVKGGHVNAAHTWINFDSKDGRYLMLVVGPFANLSDNFVVLCDFLGRARALKAIHSWNISPKHALAMNRHIKFWCLVS